MIRPDEITQDSVRNTIAAALIRRVGPERGKTRYSELADLIDADVRTIRSWCLEGKVPEGKHLFRLFAHFGPSFVDECLTLVGMGGVDSLTPSQPDPHAAVVAMSQEVAVIVQRQADGEFCQKDQKDTGPELVELGGLMQALGRAMMEGGK